AAALNPSVTTAHGPARKHARAKLRRTVEQVIGLTASPRPQSGGAANVPTRPKFFSVRGFFGTASGCSASMAMQLQIICNKVMEVAKDCQHGCLIRAGKAIVLRSCAFRNRLAAQPQHALALRGLRLGRHAAQGAAVEEAHGLSRAG